MSYSQTPQASPTRSPKTTPRRQGSIVDTVFGAAGSVLASAKATVAPQSSPVGGLFGTTGEECAEQEAYDSCDVLEELLKQVTSTTVAKDAISILTGAQTHCAQLSDDRKNTLDKLVDKLSKLPSDSLVGNTVINSLFRYLLSPMSTNQHHSLLGRTHLYRQADGTGTCLSNPRLGAAGTPFARLVPPCTGVPKSLPSPELALDVLLKRRGFVPHPEGLSALCVNFGTLLAHDLFKSGREDPTINETSSYFDLSIIYGNNEEEQKKVRTFESGKLHPDVWSNFSLSLMPPTVTALCVILARNHNSIVEVLASINEGGRFTPQRVPKPEAHASECDPAVVRLRNDPDGLKKQDEDLFQTARLINCGCYMNIILRDFGRVLLGTQSTGSTLDLSSATEEFNSLTSSTPRGQGNNVSAEMDVLWRFHSSVSELDSKWLNDFSAQFTDKSLDKFSVEDLGMLRRKVWEKEGSDPTKWNVPTLWRGEDGKFRDDDLVRILTEATDDPAGAFRARGVPASLRMVELLGMQQARSEWGLCTLNEFRRFLKLKPHESFLEWNSDEMIAKSAQEMYGDIDQLDLLVGCAAEESMEGGLAAGYTVSRAILTDTISLVRGDRFFCQDMNVANLTSWGFHLVKTQGMNSAFGGAMGKLLMRAFPRHYSFNSTYALFPFATTETTLHCLDRLRLTAKYDCTTISPPPGFKNVGSYEQCRAVLKDTTHFVGSYGTTMEVLTAAPSHLVPLFKLFGQDDEGKCARSRVSIEKSIFVNGWEKQLKEEARTTTIEFLKSKAWTFEGSTMRIDLARDVFIPTTMSLVSHTFGLPLRTSINPLGLFTSEELNKMLSDCYTFVFLNFDPASMFSLRERCIKHSQLLTSIIVLRLCALKVVPAPISEFAQHVQDRLMKEDIDAFVMSDKARLVLKNILASGESIEEIANYVVSTMLSMCQIAHSASLVVEYYLKNTAHLANLHRICHADNDEEADKQLARYVLEALRINPGVTGVARTATTDHQIDATPHSPAIKVKKGDFVWCSLAQAARDPVDFYDPTKVNITREVGLYSWLAKGLKAPESGISFNLTAVVAMVKEVFALRLIKREEGSAGSLGRVMSHSVPSIPLYQCSDGSTLSPFASSMNVTFAKEDFCE